jgi:hypothetical protein
MTLNAQQNEFVETQIQESINLDSAAKGTIQDNVGAGSFVEVDLTYPSMFNADGVRLDAKAMAKLHEEYTDRQKLCMLTYSLMSGGGMQPPRGYALSEKAAEDILRKLKYRVRRVKSHFEVELHMDGLEATIKDTQRWVAIVRALHLMGTRHDPDLDEYIKRRLANQTDRVDHSPIPV